MATEREIEKAIIGKADAIAKELSKGRDVEIKKTSTGIVFKASSKKKI